MHLKSLFFWIISILVSFEVYGQDRKPLVESHLEGFIPAVNQLNLLHSRYPQLNGTGITISIKEQKVDSADIDFKGRFKSSPLSSDFITTHASQMATLAAGGGNTSDYSKGAAWKSFISSSSFINLMPDYDEYFEVNGITIQNHSYGTGIESYYGNDASAYDSQITRKPYLLHVFSAGNLGNQVSNDGIYAGLPFGNISGSFKMSKNTLSVGAVDEFLQVAARSSRGPAHDGRIKPELVAYGIDGSSGAAAITSGISAVLQQQYFDKYGALPPSSLIRGILMNTAEDIGEPGPDFVSGYGNVRAMNAVTVIENETFLLSVINQGEEKIITLSVPGNLPELKIMLSWTDPSAASLISKALVNDLDLSVEDPSGNIFQPWVLSHYPNTDSLSKEAVRGIDTLNNQEQITIRNPEPGIYKMTIIASSINRLQNFALNWFWQQDSVYWTFPVRGDKLERDKQVVLRWNQPLKKSSPLEINRLSNWETIGIIPAGSTLFAFTPNLPGGVYQLRIKPENEYLVTDSFTVSNQPQMKVGFLCPDSTLLYWNKSVADSFNLKHLPGNYLSDLAFLKDTVYITGTGPGYYSVAETYSGLDGLRSITIDPALQGVGCYISNFLADLVNNNNGRLTLKLGTVIGVSKVKLQKFLNQKWVTIDSSLVENNRLNYTWVDPFIFGGTNYYRVELDFGNRKVYSTVESLFFFNQKENILYPNPLPRGSMLRIATADTEGLLVEFFDEMGRGIFRYGPVETIEQVPTSKLRSGVFFYRISREGKRIGAGRLVVQ